MSDNNLAMLTVLGLAFLIPVAIIVLSQLLGGVSWEDSVKGAPYESGIIQTVGTAQERFSVRFYLTAILFIIFDVEVVFLYPWAVNFRELGVPGFTGMLLFITILMAGFVYIWKKGALTWD